MVRLQRHRGKSRAHPQRGGCPACGAVRRRARPGRLRQKHRARLVRPLRRAGQPAPLDALADRHRVAQLLCAGRVRRARRRRGDVGRGRGLLAAVRRGRAARPHGRGWDLLHRRPRRLLAVWRVRRLHPHVRVGRQQHGRGRGGFGQRGSCHGNRVQRAFGAFWCAARRWCGLRPGHEANLSHLLYASHRRSNQRQLQRRLEQACRQFLGMVPGDGR
mmetsp:Transcript_100648/g.284953  ORF Transcript_100648/g.284953 Transcript_100648/m.284953 type:complete len:217 (+) Transcript_100648:351-1001(+)